jgi:hypothetical protein
MRVGVLVDVHGNLPALEAVLADLEQDQPDLSLGLGKSASTLAELKAKGLA